MSSAKHERSVVHSALWAAAGDALGWITELGGEDTIRARTGSTRVDHPLQWKRRIGGRGGVHVLLPEGTYSDDTQLRLAVCRSIRGDGNFDPETFARIELTAWQCYALGAGLGSKAAAANLARRGVNWFSNFFDTKQQSYCRSGGNGAAMRVQPHVWCRSTTHAGPMLPVMRDAIITHGHPHGFGGALFHALCLSYATSHLSVPPPDSWSEYIASLRDLPHIIEQERQLSEFWLPAWTQACGTSLSDALSAFIDGALDDINRVVRLLHQGPDAYHQILLELGCYDDRYRGSGWRTALAASALSWLYRDRPVEEALVAAANALGSDTDTIATMAGAILGATALSMPGWPIQDSEYIELQARRLAAISRGERQDSFPYPDPAKWVPPSSQSDAVLRLGDGLAVAGLGAAEPIGEAHAAGTFTWQWLKLPFGQTIFAKRRSSLKAKAQSTQLPSDKRQANSGTRLPDPELPLSPARGGSVVRPIGQSTTVRPGAVAPKVVNAERGYYGGGGPIPSSHSGSKIGDNIDAWTDLVIRSNFDNLTLGTMLNRCIDEVGSIEGAATFAGIVAKAKMARRRRHG